MWGEGGGGEGGVGRGGEGGGDLKAEEAESCSMFSL